jgi:zinc protease
MSLAAPFLADVHREVLSNGLTLLVRRDTSAPVVAVYTRVNSGYFDEDDSVGGIAHVLEHMYFKGTPTRGPGTIARETRARGGQLNAYTTYDHTTYYVVVPSDAWREALSIQCDAYANSVIDAGELSRELEVIIEEAKRKLDAPGAVAAESLYAMLFDHHRMRRWRIGHPEQLRTFTADQVRSFYRAHYQPANTIVALVGDLTVDEARDAVLERYGVLSDARVRRDRGPAEAVAAPARVRDWTGDIRGGQLVIGWRTPPRDDVASIAVGLAARVLGDGRSSRLYRALREREWVTSVGAHDMLTGDVGLFTIQAELPAESAMQATAAITTELMSLRDAGVLPDEISRLRDATRARWHRTVESMEAQASLLVDWEAVGGLAAGAARLDARLALGHEVVTDAARSYLDPDTASVAYYRPRDAAPLLHDAPVARAADTMLHTLTRRGEPLASVGGAAAAPPIVPAVHIAGNVRLDAVQHGVHVFRTVAGDVPLLVRRHAGSRVVHLAVHVPGGNAIESPTEAGLARMTLLASLKGTPGRDAVQLADAAERLGSSIATLAGTETSGWSLSAPIERLADAAALLSMVVLEPLLPVDTLRTEARLAAAELDRAHDDMSREPQRLAYEAIWGAHPYARSPLGSIDSLRQLAIDDHDALHASARRMHHRLTRQRAAVIGVVGDGAPEEMAEIVASAFRSLRHEATAPIDAPHWRADSPVSATDRDKQQTAIAMLFPAPARSSEERYAGVLLSAIASGLGGRFFEELRSKRSLAYTVSAGPVDRRTAGTFQSYIATSPAREDEARAGLISEFARFVDEPVTVEELERARRAILGARAIGLQGGGARLTQLLDAWLIGRGLVELDDVERRLLAETPASLQGYAQRWFDPTRAVWGIVRGRTTAT